jgi:hypothetical protein
MKTGSFFSKTITLNAGTIIIGTLVVFVSVMGAIYLGSWLLGPLWQGSQPPIDNNPIIVSSASPAVPVVLITETIPADPASPEVLASETPVPLPSDTPTATGTPPTVALPSVTATATGTLVNQAGTGSKPDDWAKLVSSSPEDGTYFAPTDTFQKVWTVKNVGTTTWTTDYDLIFVSGARMTDKKVFPLAEKVKPGKTIKISIRQTAPKIPGTYQGFWMLSNKYGETFGIGDQADQPFKVKITVLNVDPNNRYDFLLNYCQAVWWNSRGETIKCSDELKRITGYVYLSTEPYLENGLSDKPVLWVHSDNILEGTISGKYPSYTVLNGDHFKAKVGCMGGYPKCNVTFKLMYKIGSGPNQTLGTWQEFYGGGITAIDVDLSSLEGQSVQFILRMTCTNKNPDSAQGFWMRPRIEYRKPTPTPTATNTLTPTPTDTAVPPEDPISP